MKVKQFLILICASLLLFLGCRNETLYSDSFNPNKNEVSLKQISKESIPNIINYLKTNSDNFKVLIKKSFATNKTETVFGEVIKDYVIESTNGNNEKYYIFSIISETITNNSEIYNLEIKSDNQNTTTAKIVVYTPTEEWFSNNFNDFTKFSGNVSTYSLEGDLQTSTNYYKGTSDCNPEPCPDCPVNPGYPGNGGSGSGSGGGYPPGQGPGTGNPPTGTGGPVVYPGGSTGGSGGSGGECGWVGIYDDNILVGAYNTCTGQVIYFMNRNGGTLRVPCNGSGSGGVITHYTPLMYLTDRLNFYNLPLSSEEKFYLTAHNEISNNLQAYLQQNNNLQGAQFVKFAVSFFRQNPNTSWLTFERVFLTPKVIEDGGDNFDIAKYSTIQLQKYPLPAFSSVNQHFPRDPNNPVYGMPSNQVYQLVGGNMYTQNINGNPKYQNACAIRISRALNYAGQLVPVFYNDQGQQKSEKGNDTKNYILSAEAMLAYMLKAYPPPTYSYNGNNLTSVYNDIKGKNGIYIIIPNVRSELGASGHADIFYTNDCLVGGCHLGLPSGGSVYFWELK